MALGCSPSRISLRNPTKPCWSIGLGILIALGWVWGVQPPQSLANPPDIPDRSREVAREPFWVDADAGTTWNIFGIEIVGKVMSSQTNGQYAVVTSTTPPNGGPPLHVHLHEDELFYVVEGTYEFRLGNQKVTVNPGDLLHLPRNVAHSFRNIGSEAGLLMNTITPGGFEQFFAEIDRLPKHRPLDRQQVEDIASQYGLRFLPGDFPLQPSSSTLPGSSSSR